MECFVGNAYNSYKLYIFKYTLAFRSLSSTSLTHVSSPISDSISGTPANLGSR